ncbi:MAG: hypothetical protein IT287_01765 [Bdellovibrionaceae bacterium]|nr:hypothetical protein [Pseudobdellovibrionaceae bacterium]
MGRFIITALFIAISAICTSVIAAEEAPLCETALNCILDHDQPTIQTNDTSNNAVIPLKNLKPTNKVFQNTIKSIYNYNSLFEQCIAITQTTLLQKAKAGQLKVNSQSISSMSFKYLSFTQTELCVINKFNALLQSNFKDLCAQQNNLDCTFAFFHGKLRTSSGLATALVSLVSAGQKDNSVLPADSRTPVHFLDRGLQFMEQARLESFYLQTLQGASAADETEIQLLKTQESALLNMSIKRFLDLSEARLKETRSPASENHKQALLSRLQKLRSRSWKLQ